MNAVEPGATTVRVELDAGADFDVFYQREFPAMVALASAMVGGSGEDLAQEAMIKAHKRWAQLSGYERPGAWVRRVTINLATSRLRRQTTELKARTRFLALPPRHEVEVDEELLAAVALLPEKQRAAIALHYLDDLPVAEIAEIIECATATAKVHLHRGRLALAKQLGLATPEDDE